jgi:ubiquinol-cytochrome c reductase cytochrome b subunit
VIAFISLGYLGLEPPSGLYTVLARIFAVVYFAFFLLMPIYSRASVDKTKPVPDRVLFNAH